MNTSNWRFCEYIYILSVFQNHYAGARCCRNSTPNLQRSLKLLSQDRVLCNKDRHNNTAILTFPSIQIVQFAKATGNIWAQLTPAHLYLGQTWIKWDQLHSNRFIISRGRTGCTTLTDCSSCVITDVTTGRCRHPPLHIIVLWSRWQCTLDAAKNGSPSFWPTLLSSLP